MRRLAMLGLLLCASGCSYVSSPFVSGGEFIGETHTFARNPNRPVGNSENILRVTGRPVDVPPLTPESGNVWPGPVPPTPTLQDIERQQNNPTLGNQPPPPGGVLQLPPETPPRPLPRIGQPRGSSSPPSQDGVVTPPQRTPGPNSAPNLPNAQVPRTLITPQGPVTTNPGGNGITTYTMPNGGTGIVVPNGNGTSTLVGPDGSVTTVPNAR